MFWRSSSREKGLEQERLIAELESKVEKFNEEASKYLLTVSARDYMDSTGKNLSDFDLRSVDSSNFGPTSIELAVLKCKKDILDKARGLGAEVVCDLRFALSYHGFHYVPIYMAGTALVPKQKE